MRQDEITDFLGQEHECINASDSMFDEYLFVSEPSAKSGKFFS